MRDDEDKFLFDVSSIPHLKVDFTYREAAKERLRDELLARFRERQLVHDARVELAISGLSAEESEMLSSQAENPPDAVFGRRKTGSAPDFVGMASYPRLLDKQLIRRVGQFEEGTQAYKITPLGRVAADRLKAEMRRFKANPPASPKPEGGAKT